MGTKLGQVFLHDENIIRKIIDAACPSKHDHIVEIGCGDGILTEALADRAEHVTVFEIDPTCIAKTQIRLGDRPNITYVQGDFLKTAHQISAWRSPFKVVANVPYYISTPIIKTLMNHQTHLTQAWIMVQKEYALKLIAKPGSPMYTSFSIYAAAHWAIEVLFHVSKQSFYPVPKVDSSVITLKPTPSAITGDSNQFFAMVQSGFWGRRKPLKSALSKSPWITMDPAFKSLPYFEANPTIRAESLTLQDFLQLYEEMVPYILAHHSSITE